MKGGSRGRSKQATAGGSLETAVAQTVMARTVVSMCMRAFVHVGVCVRVALLEGVSCKMSGPNNGSTKGSCARLAFLFLADTCKANLRNKGEGAGKSAQQQLQVG
jgi:hypothetical protein